jgi:hypothetical protein
MPGLCAAEIILTCLVLVNQLFDAQWSQSATTLDPSEPDGAKLIPWHNVVHLIARVLGLPVCHSALWGNFCTTLVVSDLMASFSDAPALVVLESLV